MTGTVYVVVHRMHLGQISGSLLTDDGDLLWSAHASNIGWLQHDLTTGRRGDRLARLYLDGFRVVVTPRDGEVPADVRARYAASQPRRVLTAPTS